MRLLFLFLFLFLPFLVITGMGCAAHRHELGHATPEFKAIETTYFAATDTENAGQLLETAAANAPESPEVAFLLADHLDLMGAPKQALEYYFRVIQLCHAHGHARNEAVAAAMGIVAIRDRVAGFKAAFKGLLTALKGTPGGLPLEAWYQLQLLNFGLARRGHDREKAAHALKHTGCLVNWQVAGPFGPWTWAAFDTATPADLFGASGMGPDLGPGRGLSEVRNVRANTCVIAPQHPAIPVDGVTISQTVLALERPQTVHFRLQTVNGAAVFVGGEEIFRRDPRKGWPSRVAWINVMLPAGATAITTVIAATATTPGFSLAAFTSAGTALLHATDPAALAPGTPLLPPEQAALSASGGLSSKYAALKVALWWDDIEGAIAIAGDIERLAGVRTPVLLAALAEATSVDPSLPGDVAYERARAIEAASLALAPRLWRSRIHLSDRALGDEKTEQAIDLLTAGIALTPDEPEIHQALVAAFAAQGWIAEARAALAALTRLVPDTCHTIGWHLILARQSNRLAESARLAQQLGACNAASPEVAAQLDLSESWNDALKERNRLARLEPLLASPTLDVFYAAMAMSNLDTARSALAAALEISPADPSVRLMLADALWASGKKRTAADLLEQGHHMSYAPEPELIKALFAIDGQGLFSEHRVHGLEAIEMYNAAAPAYDTAAVYVLDRAVYAIRENGSGIAIIHAITHLKTDEAIEANGEFTLPSNALLLNARTLKSDGRILEPTAVQGKPSFSLPDLEPGDFIETEYALFIHPNRIYPGGFDTDRFYFRDFDTAFHRSEMIVSAPKEMAVVADPRGPCPRMIERSMGDRKILIWRTRSSLPAADEPLSPAPVEFLPSIRVTANATWDMIFERMRDLLADKIALSRHIADAVDLATGGISVKHQHDRMRAIYNWVMENIEPGDDRFESASHIIARRSGNRARAFAAMSDAAGYRSRLAIVKPHGADDAIPKTPEYRDYSDLLVHVSDHGWITLDIDRAPLGYLPPDLRYRPVRFIDTGKADSTNGGRLPRDTQHIKMKWIISSDGRATGEIQETLSGSQAIEWRDGFEAISSSDRAQFFMEHQLSSELNGAHLTQFDIEHLADPDQPLVLSYRVEMARFTVADGNADRITMPFPMTLSRQIGGLRTRTTPLVVAAWLDRTVDAVIEIERPCQPAQFEPGTETTQSPWGHIKRTQQRQGQTLRISYTTHLNADRISPQTYPAFLSFARQLDSISKLVVHATNCDL
ncbi:MAG: tetratricopeptide repeat protein [Myxococcota bacterium]|nr:tetratricopeptide repeat protein [Myxococcota bacterium]